MDTGASMSGDAITAQLSHGGLCVVRPLHWAGSLASASKLLPWARTVSGNQSHSPVAKPVLTGLTTLTHIDPGHDDGDEALTTATLCDYNDDDDDDCNNQGNHDHDGNDLTTAAGNVPIYGGDSAASLRENLCIRATGARGMHHFLQSGGLEVPEQAFLSNHDHTHEAKTKATAIEATTTTSDEVPQGAMVTVWAYYS
ncbi:hypothetical protein EDB85DRAFT_1888600 [Lactarius pseudohatsudake]|nr:hypothetical protein EDB85DRAFT_1888600 [Lactarius pseudohatsudake]